MPLVSFDSCLPVYRNVHWTWTFTAVFARAPYGSLAKLVPSALQDSCMYEYTDIYDQPIYF
jgi:hypothetical protein